MQILPDTRRIRIYMINTIDGIPTPVPAGDVWQEEDGSLALGLWSGLVPFAQEDHCLMAESQGLSPLEWLHRRLMNCPIVAMEIFD